MSKTYGTKSLITSALLSLALMAVCYLVIRHRVGFAVMAGLIVLFDLRVYLPRYQVVTVSDDSMIFYSVNPARKRLIISTKDLNRVSLKTISDLFYTIEFETGAGNSSIDINMHPSEFKELAQYIESTGLRTEKTDHRS